MKLQDLTILRFTHAFASGGGVENHLDDLDKMLLSRNKATIIRMYLSNEFDNEKIKIDKIGKGTLVMVPLKASINIVENRSALKSKIIHYIKLNNAIRDWIVYNPLLYSILFRKFVSGMSANIGQIEALNAHEEMRRVIKEYSVDLLVMHHVGGADSAAIIHEALNNNIPFIVENHFANDRFNHLSIREQIVHAAGIAGVSSIDVPKRLRKRFVNLSNGINTEIFKPTAACPINLTLKPPIVLLPARIVPTKGHRDLIKACVSLKKEEIYSTLVFAGRTDSIEYEHELKFEAKTLGMIDNVLFVGELSKEKLRDWYGAASVVALPTYHHEGLGRVLIEAQAMGVPVITYISGGTPEAVLHGRSGYLLKKGDINGLTKRLRELLTDEQRRREMGSEGRKFVEDYFSLKALANRHEGYYLHVLKDVYGAKYQE